MTVVAAAARDGVVVMAADSLTNVGEWRVFGAQKLLPLQFGDRRPKGELLIGFSGDAGMVDLVASRLQVPPEPSTDGDHQLWAGEIARAVTDLAVGAGLVDEGRMDASLLLGWKGRLWTLSHALAIRHEDGIAAVGSGEGPALGVLDLLVDSGVPLGEAVGTAAQVAAKRDRNCGGAIEVRQLG